jgi:hypothetical protein
MAGCYGNSSEDRHFERMCDKYTDEKYGEDLCGCEKTQSEQQNDDGIVEIEGKVYSLDDCFSKSEKFEITYYKCPDCDYLFTMDDVKNIQ